MAEPVQGGSLKQTFVVRLWGQPAPPGSSARDLRGVVEHVQSGDSVAFGDQNSLLSFLESAGRTGGSSTGGAS